MHYGETKTVRAIQGDQFIADFRKARYIMVFAANTGHFFPAKKLDVWERAKYNKITYTITERGSMAIY